MDDAGQFDVAPRARRNPVKDVVGLEALKSAAELSDALAALAGITESDVKIILHQVPANGPASGKWSIIRYLPQNFDYESMIESLRAEYGPGDYGLSFMVKGQLATRKLFSLAGPPKAAAPAVVQMGSGSSDNIQLQLARMSQEAAERQSTLLVSMMNAQAAQAAEMNKAMMGMFTTVIQATAGGGKGPDAGDLISKLAATMRSLQPAAAPPAAGQSPKELLETLAALKELIGENSGGGGDMNLMGLADKAIPLLTEAVRFAQGQGAAAQAPAPMAALPPPATIAGADHAAGAGPGVPDTPGHRIIGMIAPDVVFLLNRGHDTGLAAEFLADVLDEKGVGPDELQAVFAEFQAAGDQWPAELAKHGIQLTSDAQVQWVFAVVTQLAGLLAESSVPEQVNTPARQTRSDPNPKPNGPARTKRKPDPAGPQPGDSAHP